MPLLVNWLTGPPHPPGLPGELHVWRVGISSEPGEAGDWEWLDECERDRARRLVVLPARSRFIRSRAALRRILSRYTGQDPREITLDAGPHGKPRLPGSAVTFNLSHAGTIALIGVAMDMEIGVDVERMDEGRASDEIARRFFSGAEQAALFTLSGTERLAAFFRIWSRKEAVIKALGEGLACPLDSFDVSADPHEARLLAFRRPGIRAGDWSMFAIEAHPGYSAAAAVMGARPLIRGFDL